MRQIGISKDTTSKPGLNVGVMLNKKPIKGEIGIEIEVEGKKLPHHDSTPSPWEYHQDGSLRGEDNGEYVLQRPIPFDKVPEALDKLWKVFKAKGSVLDDSNRTSVHIHLNCQEFFLNRLTAFLGLYFSIEEILTEFCGEHRVGNLFCLRAKDAPAIISWIKRFIQSDGKTQIPENLHYSGLNANALKKFGSLEVRTLRGCSDPKVIEQWVRMLARLYKMSEDFPDPRTVCTLVSGTGPLSYFDTVLGEDAGSIRQTLGWSDKEVSDSIYNGIRLAQDLCYCRDWSLYAPMKLKADPFSRNMGVIANKLMAAQAGTSVPSGQLGVTFDSEFLNMTQGNEDNDDIEPEYDIDFN